MGMGSSVETLLGGAPNFMVRMVHVLDVPRLPPDDLTVSQESLSEIYFYVPPALPFLVSAGEIPHVTRVRAAIITRAHL